MSNLPSVTADKVKTANRGMTTSTTPPTTTRRPNPPDITAAKLRVDTLEVRAVSFRGTAHELFGEPRQDSFAFAANDEWVVLIVSDGIGSCEHSHHGSAAAVNTVATAIESGDLDPQDGSSVLRTAAAACHVIAQSLLVSSSSVSATLTVAAVERTPQDDGTHHAIIHVVGDSPALLLEPTNAAWTYLTPTDDGPSNVVRSWVPDRASEYVSFGVTLPAGSVLVLASDGFTTPLGDGSGPLGADLAARWGVGARELFQFMVDLSFNAYHDDKTVVALWNPGRAITDAVAFETDAEGVDADV